MTELEKNTQFFSRLVVHEKVNAEQSLAVRLNEARAHERTLRRATAAVAILGLLSAAGMGYATLFAPELHSGAPILLKLFCISGLASLICVIGFMSFWFHARTNRRHLIDECRKSILARIEAPQPLLRTVDPLSDETSTRRAA